MEAIYGVAPATVAQASAPRHWADRRGRHLWWRFWGDLYGVSGLLLMSPLLALGGLFAWLGWRRLAAAAGAQDPAAP